MRLAGRRCRAARPARCPIPRASSSATSPRDWPHPTDDAAARSIASASCGLCFHCLRAIIEPVPELFPLRRTALSSRRRWQSRCSGRIHHSRPVPSPAGIDLFTTRFTASATRSGVRRGSHAVLWLQPRRGAFLEAAIPPPPCRTSARMAGARASTAIRLRGHRCRMRRREEGRRSLATSAATPARWPPAGGLTPGSAPAASIPARLFRRYPADPDRDLYADSLLSLRPRSPEQNVELGGARAGLLWPATSARTTTTFMRSKGRKPRQARPARSVSGRGAGARPPHMPAHTTPGSATTRAPSSRTSGRCGRRGMHARSADEAGCRTTTRPRLWRRWCRPLRVRWSGAAAVSHPQAPIHSPPAAHHRRAARSSILGFVLRTSAAGKMRFDPPPAAREPPIRLVLREIRRQRTTRRLPAAASDDFRGGGGAPARCDLSSESGGARHRRLLGDPRRAAGRRSRRHCRRRRELAACRRGAGSSRLSRAAARLLFRSRIAGGGAPPGGPPARGARRVPGRSGAPSARRTIAFRALADARGAWPARRGRRGEGA